MNPCSITIQILNKHKQQNTKQKSPKVSKRINKKQHVTWYIFSASLLPFSLLSPIFENTYPEFPPGIPPPSRGPYPQLGWETRRHPRRPSTAKAFQKLRRHGRHERMTWWLPRHQGLHETISLVRHCQVYVGWLPSKLDYRNVISLKNVWLCLTHQ